MKSLEKYKWQDQVIDNNEVFTLVKSDITPVELMTMFWEGKYHWKNRFLASVNDAAPFSFNKIVGNLEFIKSYGTVKDVTFAMYDLKKEDEKPLKKECGNCEKYYRHYLKGDYEFIEAPFGHCFPTDRSEPLNPRADDKPHKNSCFVWKKELMERVLKEKD